MGLPGKHAIQISSLEVPFINLEMIISGVEMAVDHPLARGSARKTRHKNQLFTVPCDMDMVNHLPIK